MHLKLITANIYPFYVWSVADHKVTCKGIASFMVDTILASLNSSYEIIYNDGKAIGRETSPGNWSGIIGRMIRKEVDLYLGFYPLLPELFPYVGYTTSFDGTRFSVLSGPPRSLTKEHASVFSTVGTDLWSVLVAVWIVISLLYYYFGKADCKLQNERIAGDFSIVGCLLIFYGILFQKGFERLPKTTGRRLMVAGWLIQVVVLMTTIAGTFSSKLVAKLVPERIDSIGDILRYPELKPYVSKGTATHTYLQLSKNEELQAVWRQVLKYDGFKSFGDFFKVEFLEGIASGQTVALGSVEAQFLGGVGHYCKKKESAFHIARHDFLFTPFSLFYRKNISNVVVEKLNQRITLYGCMGFHQVMWSQMSKNSGPCLEREESAADWAPLTLENMFQVFGLLCYGTASSCIIVCMELVSLYVYSHVSHIIIPLYRRETSPCMLNDKQIEVRLA